MMSELDDFVSRHQIGCGSIYTIYGDEYNTRVFPCTCGAEQAAAELANLHAQLAQSEKDWIAEVYNYHIETLHNADFEVCQNPLCKYAHQKEQLAAALEKGEG